uniref:50S ribosomal protein L6 n=1 Tax=Lygus hesperus TaxID=30085 RepID=A0A0A9YT20_LYGHE
MSSWKKKLHETYSALQQEFYLGNFDTVIQRGELMVTEYRMLSPGGVKGTLSAQSIPDDIPILPTIAMVVRAKYELNQSDQIEAYLRQIFDSLDVAPYDIFVLLLEVLAASHLSNDIIRLAKTYLACNKYTLLLSQYVHPSAALRVVCTPNLLPTGMSVLSITCCMTVTLRCETTKTRHCLWRMIIVLVQRWKFEQNSLHKLNKLRKNTHEKRLLS